MKILYVILSHKDNEDKINLQKSTWLSFKGVEDNYIYLTKSSIEDTYENVPRKYSDFIREFSHFNEYDWVFFCDDDTFAFPKKLSHLLRYFNASKPLVIGRTGVYEGYLYCSGGAGFAVSRNLILRVKSYMHNQSFKHLPNSDTSFGMWAKEAVNEVVFVDRADQFQTQHLRHDDNGLVDIDACISFHYCKEYDFKILRKYLKYSV